MCGLFFYNLPKLIGVLKIELTLNITTALTLRKRINNIISKIQTNLSFMQMLVEKENLDVHKDLLYTDSIEKELELFDAAYESLEILNNGIDSANSQGKAYLDRINSINKKLSVYTRLANGLASRCKSKERNPITGVWEYIELVPITNIDFQKKVDELTHQKFRLEDELSKYNAKSNFTIIIDDKIYTMIYGVQPLSYEEQADKILS